MKTRISKETWQKLIVIRFAQDFIKEWLDLYDAYFRLNPPLPKDLQANILMTISNQMLNKWFYYLKEHNLNINDFVSVLDDWKRTLENGN